jgi:HSP20 family protein
MRDTSEALRWMWPEACAQLARAERLHQQFFQIAESVSAAPAWEPPVDVLETEDAVIILVALPGVDLETVETQIVGGVLIVAGQRLLPQMLHRALIHRLELPQGRFERRVRLPGQRFGEVQYTAAHGCLIFKLSKAL